MKNKLYFFVVAVTLAFCIFTQGDFSRFLLGFEFLLWIALYVCAQILSRYIDKSMCPPFSQALREQEIALEIRLENQCGFPVSEAYVELKCRDCFSDQVQSFQGTAMLDGKDKTTLRFVLRAQHYGVLTVWPERVQIGDPLGIHFVASRFPRQSWEIAVLPELTQEREQQSLNGSSPCPVDVGDTMGGRGDDLSAAYELRAYQEGEPLRNVHWKLTAKTGELMVKEFAKDTESMTLVFLDLDSGGKPYSRKDWDSFLEVVAAFASAQIRAGNHFEFIWLDAQAQSRQVQVRGEEDAKTALTALLHEKPRTGTAGETAYKEKWIHEAYDAVVRLDLWGEITREENNR